MYLKSIEVQGFKSFANKMKFQFHSGITGIVGPNGSGKSNVGDAVRWVLGEQRVKQLRGSNMQDVIFSGTENRKPLGFAMVAITLDNSDRALPVDYNEVTVTRRLYRSGESEYLINGANCRLKDINELFYDTGIGKEGYSIIGQGQIDKILNGKPEERRELFDEAAGIVKFKRRKLTAQKKLEDENNNLTRVNDILSELTRQIGPLERQSEKAKIYLKKKEDLKIYDVNMFLLDMETLSGQISEVEEKLTISEHDIAMITEELEKAKGEYEKAEKELEELNARIEEEQNRMNQNRLVKQQMENQIQLLEEQIRSAQKNDQHYLSRMQAIDGELKEKQQEKEKEEANLDVLQEENLAAARQDAQNDSALSAIAEEVNRLETEIARGQSLLIDLLNARSNTKAKLQRYDTMKEQIQIRGAELAQKLLTAKSEEAQLEEVKAKYREEYDCITGNIASMQQEKQEIEAEIQKVQRQMAERAKEQEAAQTAYHREASKLESLRNIAERYDGYGNSIRRVMEQKEREAGLLGVVADLFKTEKKYEVAMETALGGSIQNIVTDNENTAKKMIEFLKRNKYGRATFLPLTAMRKKGGLGNDNALYEPGVVGVASTLVDADPMFDNLVEYLLGKTLVVDQIDHAIAIAKKYKQSIRIVTLDGELLSPGGSMSGGAFKNNSNLLGRRREIEELEKEVQKKKNSLAQWAAELEEIRQKRNLLRESLTKQTEKIQKEYLKQNTARMKMEELDTRNEASRSGYDELKRESLEMEEQLKEIRAGKETIQEELARSQEEEKQLESSVSEAQGLLEQKRHLLEQETAKQAEYRTKTAGMRQREEFVRQNLERLEREIRHLLSEQKELESNVSKSKEEMQEKQRQIDEIRTNLTESSADETGLESQISAMQEERRNKNAVQKEFFRRREELSDQMNGLDKEKFRLENKKERLTDYRERQINYMWEEYEITPSEASKYRTETEESPAQMKKSIAQLKNEIKALGPVNVNAIEEYKEQSERYTFLSAQHADLVKAGEDLKKIIEELDNGMRRQFKEKFAIMQKEFEKSFKELFGGGKGTLELVEDEDILEAGIRITAQPPGKKLVNMMQMSGGEKALTAIALLFAIQNMKPSPFCLLDEIEAALDESNVSRYANYLHKLTKNTQFIIITHRRGTMAVADRLYGITMQEKGVSTQVSVNMVEGDLDK